MTDLAERCPVCGARADEPFVELQAVPVFCNVLWPTRETAIAAPRGDVQLVFCGACGMIWNSAFEARLVEYAPAYENSLHFSEVFREYAADLARRLIERYEVRGKDVIDIGSGKGDFLSLVCELGGNRGVGFDPSYEGDDLVPAGAGEVRFVRDLYSEAHADVPADLVCCRHVLEHVPDPVQLLASVRRALASRPDAVLYFEVPAAEHVLGRLSAWDIIYEHCSLFSAPALRSLFERAGFDVLDLGFSYGGQYLWLEAKQGVSSRPDADPAVGEIAEQAAAFEGRFRHLVEESRERVAQLQGRGPMALWGAGSKGVTFLNLVAPAETGGAVAVVDVNPRKQGKHVPGRGDRVVPPDALRRLAPTSVLVMNPLYREEIEQTLVGLGIEAAVVLA